MLKNSTIKSKSKAERSLGFKSVTFNVQKTLNDSHSLVIHLNSQHYFPGDTVSGYVYLNFSEDLPGESLDLIVAGWEETSFTLKLKCDLRDHEGSNKLFGKRVFLKKNEDDTPIKAGEYSYPFQFQLPFDLPASVSYQDPYCTCAIKYEIGLNMISKNKEIFDDIHAKKFFFVYERKKLPEFSKTILEKGAETFSESKVIQSQSGKDTAFLGNDAYKLIYNEDCEEAATRTEFYETPIAFKSLCCFGDRSLVFQFHVQKSQILIGEEFHLINKLQGNIDLEYIQYFLYREVRCQSNAGKIYINKALIEEQGVNKFLKSEMNIRVNFKFTGNSELKVFRMPTSSNGKLIKCAYHIIVLARFKGCFGRTEEFKIPVHVSGESSSILIINPELENMNMDECLKHSLIQSSPILINLSN